MPNRLQSVVICERLPKATPEKLQFCSPRPPTMPNRLHSTVIYEQISKTSPKKNEMCSPPPSTMPNRLHSVVICEQLPKATLEKLQICGPRPPTMPNRLHSFIVVEVQLSKASPKSLQFAVPAHPRCRTDSTVLSSANSYPKQPFGAGHHLQRRNNSVTGPDATVTQLEVSIETRIQTRINLRCRVNAKRLVVEPDNETL